ncbi:MAG: hypothetical protein COT73_09350 [Bdellovibrio sp. CG10_big_fil_rev_8_21_14_0_10_47_8]|nr:MAG: hypothetical protein COT73_09350 [Bdellovibrio sp. CG10_big_fil_rev_8_21_14_0_10_47_8]
MKVGGLFVRLVCVMKSSKTKALLLLFLTVISTLAPAAQDGAPYFESLNSPFLNIIDENHPLAGEDLGTYPWYARLIQGELWKWQPSGRPRWVSPECRIQTWKDLDRFPDCEKQYETGWNDLVSNALGSMGLRLDIPHYPWARHVMIQLPNKIRLKGWLAMKPDSKKRPLIIFRTGIFSNTQEFYPERFLFLMAFEQSPFNVLVLESLSGSEFVKHNASFSLGGFDEGLQNYLIAEQLQKKEEPIAKFIDSVHLMGMSLGGAGVMYATLLNHLNTAPGSVPVIRGSLAFCPLLNLRDTLDYHQGQGISMAMMNFWAAKRLTALHLEHPEFRKEEFIQDILSWLEVHYQEPLTGWPAGLRLGSRNLSSKGDREALFWRANSFMSDYSQVKTPLVIVATKKDPIVPWYVNSGRIQDGRLDLQDSNVRLFNLEQGYHCSLGVSYDWSTMASLIQSYFLENSPGFRLEKRTLRWPLISRVLSRLKDGKKLDLKLDLEPQLKNRQVRFRVRFDQVSRPSWLEKWISPTMSGEIPFSELEFNPGENFSWDQNQDLLFHLLQRWSYQNIHAQIDGTDLVLDWARTSAK